jgi:hypothetical protein
MSGAGSVERTRKQIAVGGSLIAGALAVYWFIDLQRKQVPDVATHEVKITIALLSILALAFGLVTRRPKISHRITIGPLLVAPWAAAWSQVFSRKHSFGAPGIATCVGAFVLITVAFLVREPWRRRAAQPAVATAGASRRRFHEEAARVKK